MQLTGKLTGMLVASLSAVIFGSTAFASPADGTVIGATKVLDNGPASDRYNLVLVAEGYQNAEQDSFNAHVQTFIDFFLATPPFSTNSGAFNIWRINVASNESGADDPIACGGSGAEVATYFDTSFCTNGIRRLLVGNQATVLNVLDAQVPEWDQALVIVNSTIFGGAGGAVGFTSVASGWQSVAIHEFGHSGFSLADEYEYYAGCGVDTDRDYHPAVEPVEVNVTIETDPGLIKWGDLIDGSTPVPTTANANCTVCDPQGNPYPGQQVTGLYEGAHYYHCDAFRPTFNCMMRNFAPFCPVCTRRILEVLEPYQPASCEDDAYEEDDTCPGPFLAALPASQDHKHCDEDWLFFVTEPGHTYLIETHNVVGDTTLTLYEGCNTQLAFDDDGGVGLGSRIEWTAPGYLAADVRIAQYNNDYQPEEAYTVTVTDVTTYSILTVTGFGSGSGTVVSDPAGVNCGADCVWSFIDGTPVTLTATPNAGSQFVGWSGACAGSNPVTTVTMDANKTCNAQFDQVTPGSLQIVYGLPGAVGAQAGGAARFDVMYDVSDADPTLTGIGIRVHYDSSKLTFDQLNETLAFGRLFNPALVAPEQDDTDFDADPNTDRFISLAWVDFGGSWPGSLPEKLAAVHFTTAPGFTGDTPVNFTASDLAAGYALDAGPVTVFEQPCTLDVDDNGGYGALTDGVLTVRHLFGFTGAQLTSGAIGPGASRTDPAEIISYLDGCPDMLDPDGNGVYGALTDGVLIVRYLFGFTGAQLTSGAIGGGATRTDPAAIIAYLDGYSPALSPPGLQASPEQGTAPRGLQELASRVSRAAARGSDKVYDVTVDYAASEASLTGLGLRMHFDSSRLSLLGLSDVFATGMLQYQVQDDVLDFDGDASTDRFILVSWMDPWGDWPGAYEAELFTARFKAVKRQGSGKTTVRYTVAEAAAGMEARFEPVEIGPGSNVRKDP